MRIGVTGPTGRLGSELVKNRQCIPLTFRLEQSPISIRETIAPLGLDAIINTAAYTDVDGCETNPSRAALVNTSGVYNLTQAFDGKIVHISTDYIFDGNEGPYTIHDTPRPIQIYGWSKLGGEMVLLSQPRTNILIVRTTVLYDNDSNNFVGKVIDQLEQGKTVTIYGPALYGSPTYVPHLAKAIITCIRNGIIGIINITGEQVMSRFVLACLIASEFGYSRDLVKVTPEAQVIGARRPEMAGLVVTETARRGIPIYHVLDGLKAVKAARRIERFLS